MIQALTGQDVIKIDNRLFNDLIDGDTVILEYPNELGSLKTGKNGNSIFAFNATGLNVKVKIRLVMGSSDDKWMQSRLAQWVSDSSAFILMTGQFVKRVGDGGANVGSVTYDLSGGIPTKIPSGKTNADGDTEQSVVTYELSFSNGPRSIS
jgi:hypothetical protein